jgi:hypothetical protein
MQTHVKVLAYLHIVLGALGMLTAIGLFALFGGIAGVVAIAEGGGESLIAVPILGAIGFALLIFILALSVPGLVVGFGLLKYQPWARIGMIILSILHLLNFPFGTALGVYGLWALMSAEVTAAFQTRTRYS